MTAETLPAINASLNALSTTLLITGFLLIRRKRYAAHGAAMSGALVTSSLFLGCYVWHKSMYGNRSLGVEAGWLVRAVYLYVILIPHLLLAILMLPMIAMTVWRAFRRDWPAHRRLARPTLLVWLYVSITGVIIYFLLYHVFPAPAQA